VVRIMINALTIDVEDYWSIFFRDWLNMPAEPSDAVVKNTEWFLETLSNYNVKATFFMLGEVAEKFPSLVRRIADCGHEIASHGSSHKQIFKLTEEEFRREIVGCKKRLEDIVSKVVLGYRAPAFSITPQTKWALDILADVGFEYDSSVFPISGRRYGWPGFSKGICKLQLASGEEIIEVPISTVNVFGRSLPAAGGGYIRHFPYIVTKLAIRHIQKTRPAIVYMHPYEIDMALKELTFNHLSLCNKMRSFKFHFLQLRNRKTMVRKIGMLLSEFKFAPLRDVIKTAIKTEEGIK